ncbi:hypothetical protein ACFJGV_10565 [Cnuibacter sp. UC19_7]|uniref:hypothetical protein n=1 Tax=Cnuibacter sp. UC19_7 TaxID=3350166 RepID=UPI003670E217
MSQEPWVMPDGSGAELGVTARESVDVPVEGYVDGSVVAWYPPYAQTVAGIRARLPLRASELWQQTVADVTSANPLGRDEIAPAPWRQSLRVLAFVAACATFPGIAAGLGLGRGSTVLETTSIAPAVGIAAVVAVACLILSMVRPSRMGRPSRMAQGTAWLTTAGTLGSAGAMLIRSDTWTSATWVWWWVGLGTGLVSLVVAAVVEVTRRRSASSSRLEDADVLQLRLAAVAGALAEAVSEVRSAWSRLDPAVRVAIERERQVALHGIASRLADAPVELMAAEVPGVLVLPDLADAAHRGLHLGAA